LFFSSFFIRGVFTFREVFLGPGGRGGVCTVLVAAAKVAYAIAIDGAVCGFVDLSLFIAVLVVGQGALIRRGQLGADLGSDEEVGDTTCLLPTEEILTISVNLL